MEAKTYKTEAAAKRAATKGYSPVIVELPDGRFDWYPQGHPLPEGAEKVSFWRIDQWRSVQTERLEDLRARMRQEHFYLNWGEITPEEYDRRIDALWTNYREKD